jgi:hypothetical protein
MNKQKNLTKIKVIRPIENHQTAAWAGVKKLAPETRIIIQEEMVLQAKEYVDENQK